MFDALRAAITKRIEVAAELAGFVVSLSGASLAALFGKLILAVLLGAIALGLFLRGVARRAGPRVAEPATPRWVGPASALLSLLEAAVLVEATQLPVRFDQPGFELHHWGLVLACVGVGYFVQERLLRAFAARRGTHAGR